MDAGSLPLIGEDAAQVRKLSIRTLLTEREVMPVFERAGGAMHVLNLREVVASAWRYSLVPREYLRVPV